MTNSDMTCEAFDAALPDYLEGTLDGSMRASVERHLRECVRCAGLVRDLENIRKEAAALPDLVPSRDLWSGIEARIAAPVIPLAARPERQRRFVPAWMGIAAAALIVSTAGVTYLLTARSLRPGGDSRVALGNPATQIQSTNPATQGGSGPTEADGAGVPANLPGQPDNSPSQQGAATTRTGVPVILASQSAQSEPSQSDAVYGREIEMLQNIGHHHQIEGDTLERNSVG